MVNRFSLRSYLFSNKSFPLFCRGKVEHCPVINLQPEQFSTRPGFIPERFIILLVDKIDLLHYGLSLLKVVCNT